MNGRIKRPEQGVTLLDLPEIGRLHIGMKAKNQYGKEYPMAVDYFIPTGKYSELFKMALGEKPNTISVIFPDDNPEKVCNQRYEYRDDKGALVARGDGDTFEIWDGKKYAPYKVEQYPNVMEQVARKYPKKPRNENDNGWDIALTLRFIVPAVRGVVGVWTLSTKGAASSIKNICNSFDGVQAMRGTVRNSVFDLSVSFAKSNKPGQSSRYPVLSLIANDTRIEDIKQSMLPKQTISLLLSNENK